MCIENKITTFANNCLQLFMILIQQFFMQSTTIMILLKAQMTIYATNSYDTNTSFAFLLSVHNIHDWIHDILLMSLEKN